MCCAGQRACNPTGAQSSAQVTIVIKNMLVLKIAAPMDDCLLIRGAPFKAVVAPLLASDRSGVMESRSAAKPPSVRRFRNRALPASVVS